MKSILSSNIFLRLIFLPLLKLFNRDIEINHPWTQDVFKLALFEHRGYWFHSKNREKEEMIAFKNLIKNKSILLEVGGHIGFTSLYFAKLIGKDGKLYVFEPGTNNLPYLKKNISNHSNIFLEEYACSNKNGNEKFYQDNLTGQNNSLIPNFAGLDFNKKNAPGIKVQKKITNVKTIRISDFCKKNSINPDFIKIDVEGHEYGVLLGAEEILKSSNPPKLMIEVQQDFDLIENFLKTYNFQMYSPKGKKISTIKECTNVFALHKNSNNIKTFIDLYS